MLTRLSSPPLSPQAHPEWSDVVNPHCDPEENGERAQFLLSFYAPC